MTDKEMEKGFREIWDLFKETDERLDKRFKRTEEEIEKTSKAVEETRKTAEETTKALDGTRKTVEDTSKGLAEARKTVEKTSKTVEAAIKAVSDLTGKWGRFVEGLIAPAAERLFKARGIKVDKVYQRVKTHHNGDTMEVDILALSGEYAVLIEAKSTLKVEDVKEHIERLEGFKKFFPEYKGLKVVGAVGGIVIDEESDKYAYKNGLFVIGESGETVIILNNMKFRPKIW